MLVKNKIKSLLKKLFCSHLCVETEMHYDTKSGFIYYHNKKCSDCSKSLNINSYDYISAMQINSIGLKQLLDSRNNYDSDTQEKKMQYISLDEEDFSCLVRGGILKLNIALFDSVVNLSLKGIEYSEMINAIETARENENWWEGGDITCRAEFKDTYKDCEKNI